MSRKSTEKSEVKVLVTQLCPTLCDPMDCIACEAPLSMEFSRQESWSGLPFASPGNLPDPGIKPGSLVLQADSLLSEPPRKPLMWAQILILPYSRCLTLNWLI